MQITVKDLVQYIRKNRDLFVLGRTDYEKVELFLSLLSPSYDITYDKTNKVVNFISRGDSRLNMMCETIVKDILKMK